ncbi:phosphoglucosamine mutase [Nibricoccus sp. IMCC34717]|uniref:phosphoglucosamine mutase n=1 Tax=Nibricoccus sp. IMCC34717 TaxID=3034021 RepID=UPI0038513C1E
MSRNYFGTDGVRGRYGGPVINENFAARLGEAAARFAKGSGVGGFRVLVGRDTRRSGPALASAVARGLAAAGAEVFDAGVVPTPALALATRGQGFTLGVMITASHNPAEDNGIKFFNTEGAKLSDEQEERIEALLPAEVQGAAGALLPAEAAAAYRRLAASLLPAGALACWRVVLDTANGATVGTSPAVLRELGAEVVTVGAEPNGENINAGCGSEHPEALARRVVEERARIGIAHDGDGDRCILCDENGVVLDGDEIVAILATAALARGALPGGVVVVTQQSNLGLDAAIAAAGGRTVRTQIGDRYVLEGMRASGARLGGESSGHILALDVTPTGDGLVAALLVLRVMRETGKPLSELRRVMRKFPQRTAALRVREKRDLAGLPVLLEAIQALEAALGTQGRVLVRYSGTEAKLRLLVEGPTDAAVDAGIQSLDTAVRASLEVV